LKESGKKTFLLTNSPWGYTDEVMRFNLGDASPKYKNWLDYFDVVVVAAEKPKFFGIGTTMRVIDTQTGRLRIHNSGESKVYQGGNLASFLKVAPLSERENILYVGDHLLTDIIVPKKHGWRNVFLVPELKKEFKCWETVRIAYHKLRTLEYLKAEIYKGLDISCTELPDISVLKKEIKGAIKSIDEAYNKQFGSLFRNGLKSSFFAMQMQRYSDLYTANYANLLYYPLFYYFSAPDTAAPHELPYVG